MNEKISNVNADYRDTGRTCKRSSDIDCLDYVFSEDNISPKCGCDWHKGLLKSYPDVYKILFEMLQDKEKFKGMRFRIRTDTFITYSALKKLKNDKEYKKIPRYQFGNFVVIPFFGCFGKNSLNIAKGRLSNDNSFEFLSLVKETIECDNASNFWNTFDEMPRKAYIEYFKKFESFDNFLKYNHLEGYDTHFDCCTKGAGNFEANYREHTQTLINTRTEKLLPKLT